jgi:hypothetical protein
MTGPCPGTATPGLTPPFLCPFFSISSEWFYPGLSLFYSLDSISLLWDLYSRVVWPIQPINPPPPYTIPLYMAGGEHFQPPLPFGVVHSKHRISPPCLWDPGSSHPIARSICRGGGWWVSTVGRSVGHINSILLFFSIFYFVRYVTHFCFDRSAYFSSCRN